mgnify:FL=1
MRRTISFFLTLLLAAPAVLADYKITQRTVLGDEFASEVTTYAKGVRERRESKLIVSGDAQMAAMMEQMMPPMIEISQCDLKQDVQINPKTKSYFVNYRDWSSVPPEKLARRPKQKMVIKGTATVSSTVSDSGRRQQMFGLTARWLKHVNEIETSADSCDGANRVRMESEGWFVNLTLESETCPIPRAEFDDLGGCRPRMIVKSAQDPGFLLDGTIKIFQNGKEQGSQRVEIIELSKQTLDQSLFEVPAGFTEVDSYAELTRPSRGPADTTAITTVANETGARGSHGMKTVAIDFFSGSTSKIDQNELRSLISSRLSAAGISGYAVTSQADLISGNFANVVAVDIEKAKESTGAKIGGLFGKVTGTGGASKAGDSEATISITLYAQDRKTVVATATATEKVKGSSNDAVKAAIEKALPAIIAKLK